MEKEKIKNYLKGTINETNFNWLGKLRRGKVRDIYEREKNLLIITTDRVSAFDRVITTLPLKGYVLNSISVFWFQKTSHIAKNHIIDVPHPNAIIAKKLKPLNVEMVLRAYITGVTSTSLWTLYSRGNRNIGGNILPDGLVKNQKLPEPIITPSTKAEIGMHDETVSPEMLINAGIISKKMYEEIAEISLELFKFGSRWCEERGLILVDTKYEFGIGEDGTVMLMDEIHTPDSSRFWDASTYDEKFKNAEEPLGFDKEYIRRYLKEKGFAGEGTIPQIPDEIRVEAGLKYISSMEKITGLPFSPPYENAMESLANWAEKMKL